MMLVATLALLAQMAVVPADAQSDERVTRGARNAQARFERYRRANLPRKPGGGTWRPCDARVGRFCYWYDSTQADAVPEPRRIADARLQLLSALDSAARISPDDPWISGQRVRYHIEAGNLDAALGASTGCRSDRWWCASLSGLVHHVAQRYPAADSAFEVALRTMPPQQRCEWVDLSIIADTRWRRAFRDASCEARERRADAAFALGQPLWMIEGRDFRSEHFARLTMALVSERSSTAHGMVFGDDNRELMVRYGWAEWFTRHELSPSSFPDFVVTGHDREPSYYFLPDVDDPTAPRPDEASWRLRESRAPTRYAPRHIDRLTHLPHQLARFRRGDSMLVVAAFAPADSILARDDVRAALAAMRHGAVSVLASTRDRSVAGVAANDTTIVSLEALGDSTKHAARARYTIGPVTCSSWCLSDLLLVDPARAERSAAPAEAVRGALTDLRVESGTSVGVFFELAPARAARETGPTAATLTLTVTPVRVSFARQAAARLRLTSLPEAVRMRWQSVIGESSELVTIHIPEGARGRYRLQLTVAPRGGGQVTSARDLEIVP